ncbi:MULTISPECIES: AAA family ATPase [Bacteroidales]|mgnify:FL=1|jgi:predicted ATP-dependent endonuclease of OLD family|uniref:Abortive infection protein n=3 Tax=Bacteroidales TaxID=171549 RepID=A0A1B1S7S9_9BACT|nr:MULTISPECIES: ATP-binding protein [Bacteroidales]MBJ2166569.1 ATP-binding protein [Muribaculaceae bacterium]ANU62839.1 abortive infection protein [Muribaculum intestinale]ASB36664.1 ATP-binding protein [Muribaculum intestinale]NBH65342.1 ATP-binding protein [Phocaeicola sartorii]NVK93409.1 ATP-binding protein [Bacteroides sp. L10-4]
MLVNFTFKNFRSFRDEMTLSMEAASIQELSEAVVKSCDEELLPVAVMYGANSSGKSNVLKALKAMRDVLLNSVKLNPKDKLDAEPFCLDLTSAEQPTSFEIQFTLNGSKFRYGFDYTANEILAEWLYEKRVGEREFELFLRSGNEFKISKTRFAEGNGKQDATPSNRLFVSLVAQLNGKLSQSILDWFSSIEYISGMDGKEYAGKTLEMLFLNQQGATEIKQLFTETNLGFNELDIELDDSVAMKMKAESVHNLYDADGTMVGVRTFSTDKMESEGTKKMIEIAGPLVDAILSGKILVVDELDAKLHPFLTRKIIGLFMDREINRNGAQLIFATHDTNLLNLQYLRRDQIWFTEKDKTDSTELYSLVEFRDDAGNKVRNDRNIEKDYINGRYGAIPFMS